MNSFLSVKNFKGKSQHYKVPKEVVLYVRQLEAYIKYPEKSKLKEFYPERFKNEEWHDERWHLDGIEYNYEK